MFTATIPGDPDVVFGTLTAIDGLPDWNDAITAIVERPDDLVPGAEWVVEMHALGQTWRSRSTLTHLDRAARRFSYRSRTDDGNPSWAAWEWSVLEHPAGAAVSVTWELHPATFWRRRVLVHVRNRQLARTEVPASLAALSRQVVRSSSSTERRVDSRGSVSHHGRAALRSTTDAQGRNST